MKAEAQHIHISRRILTTLKLASLQKCLVFQIIGFAQVLTENLLLYVIFYIFNIFFTVKA